MQERINKIKKVLYEVLQAERCSLNTANWLEVELDEVFPQNCEIQGFITELALYRPQGGDCLINEKELVEKCKSIWNYMIKLGF